METRGGGCTLEKVVGSIVACIEAGRNSENGGKVLLLLQLLRERERERERERKNDR